eukprot:7942725-Lingulodinium_polyedra.AAC.1
MAPRARPSALPARAERKSSQSPSPQQKSKMATVGVGAGHRDALAPAFDSTAGRAPLRPCGLTASS